MKKYLLELPTDLHTKAKTLAAMRGMTLKQLIIDALEQEIEFRNLNDKFRLAEKE